MTKYLKRMVKKAGLPPGEVVHIGPEKSDPPTVTLIQYNDQNAHFYPIHDVKDIVSYSDNQWVNWLNVQGVHDPTLIRDIGSIFNLHGLILEDVVNTRGLPKFEEGGLGFFIVIKAISFDGHTISFDHIAICLQENAILSFQECTQDTFKVIKDRIQQKKGKISQKKADYLMYALFDYVIDTYFDTLQKIDVRISELNQEVDDFPTHDTLKRIQALKKQILALKRNFWTTRDIVLLLKKSESPLLSKKIGKYLTDLHEHIGHIIDISESFREELIDLSERHLAVINLRSNDITKMLTIVSSIFLPLTFVTGVYGMNFKFMPELEQPYAYPILLISMVVVVTLLFAFFKRKRWFE
ncbi:MAG: magnesium/cobalt transporter CorA [Candidatus Margulisiibacteriota bacterium]